MEEDIGRKEEKRNEGSKSTVIFLSSLREVFGYKARVMLN